MRRCDKNCVGGPKIRFWLFFMVFWTLRRPYEFWIFPKSGQTWVFYRKWATDHDFDTFRLRWRHNNNLRKNVNPILWFKNSFRDIKLTKLGTLNTIMMLSKCHDVIITFYEKIWKWSFWPSKAKNDHFFGQNH